MCILSLLCNAATLALNVATLQRRDVSKLRRQFYPPLERRDVRFQRCDVDFELLWNVATLISNVATLIFYTLWNVATLISNVATLIFNILWNVATLEDFLSGTSRRCPERRDVVLFKAKHSPFFCSYPSFFLPEP